MVHRRIKLLRWGNGIGFVGMLGVNALAEALPLGGVTTGDVSKTYFNLFTPAPVTFAIWGVIYLLLAGFILRQAGAFRKRLGESEETVERAGGWFLFSCLCNAGWLLCWHYDLICLSTLLMLGLLISLAVLTGRLRRSHASRAERLLTEAPFSLYFGWITVATIANVAVWLTKRGWDGWGLSDETWTALLLIAGAVLALVTTLRRREWVYPLAVLWAYVGVIIRHVFDLQGAYPGVIVTAALCCILLMIVGVRAAVRADS